MSKFSDVCHVAVQWSEMELKKWPKIHYSIFNGRLKKKIGSSVMYIELFNCEGKDWGQGDDILGVKIGDSSILGVKIMRVKCQYWK